MPSSSSAGDFLRFARDAFLFFLVATICVGSPSRASAQDTAAERRIPYTYTIVQESTQSFVNGTAQKIDSRAEVDYTWAELGAARTLYLDRTFIKTAIDGKIQMHAEMSREAMTTFPDGQPKSISAATAPPELKAILEDTFGKPLYRIDAAAKSNNTTVLATGEARELATEGVIGQASVFHPVIPPGQTEWETGAAMEFASEGVVRGKLRYQRIPNERAGLHRVRGTLTNPHYAPPSGKVVMKNIRYEVTGEQTYDATTRVWIDGKLSINMTYDLAMPNGAKIGAATGTQIVTFKKR